MTYAERIGFGFKEYAGKFESLKEVINADSDVLRRKDLPADLRRFILDTNERLRRGVLTFEYLARRTPQKPKKAK